MTITNHEFRWQYERGNFQAAKPFAVLAQTIIEEKIAINYPRRKHLLSLVHDFFGCFANGTNNPAASMTHNIQFLDLRIEIARQNGQNDELLAYAHNQLGCSWMMARDWKQGAKFFELALNIWLNLPTYHKGDASMEYSNLSLAYLLQGEIEHASEIISEGYQARIDGHGLDDKESFRCVSCKPCSPQLTFTVLVVFCMLWVTSYSHKVAFKKARNTTRKR
jgi:hypothetical protein